MPHRSPAVTTTPLRLYLLGSFAIEKIIVAARSTEPVTKSIQLPACKLESLLAYLALNPGPQSREKLASQFWGDFSDRKAQDSLRNALAVLRKHLGEDLLLTTHSHAQLNTAYPLWLDVREFKVQSENSTPAAIQLYRGDLLTEVYDDWIMPEREECRRLYLDALLRFRR